MYCFRAGVRSLSLAACLMLFASSAHAVPITNPSFELGTFVNDGNGTMVLPVGSTAITGWAVVFDQLAWIISPNPWGLAAQDGNRFLDLTAYPSGAPFGGIAQTFATIPGGEYDLSFYLGTYTTRWGGPPVSIQTTAGDSSQTCTVSAPSTASTWTLCAMTFTATAPTTTLTLRGTAGFSYIGLDNVAVTGPDVTAVPEPATVVLLGGGLVAAGTRARKRRRKETVARKR